MDELLLLSKCYISKVDFIEALDMEEYHFDIGGDDNQLWLINNKTDNCVLTIDLLFIDDSGNVIRTNEEEIINDELYEDTNAPYKAYLYNIEYNDYDIMINYLTKLISNERDIYIEYNGNGDFIKLQN